MENPAEKFVKNSPGRGTLRVRAAAAAMTAAGGDEVTAKSVDVDLSERGATVDRSDVENVATSNVDGGEGDMDDSEEGDAAMLERP